MHPIQTGFIAFTFLAPPLLWLASRRIRSPRLAQGVSLGFVFVLVVAYVLNIVWLAQNEMLTIRQAFPMHLCDWAAVATMAALFLRRQMVFELAYFWGLAGTLQALFTPAVEIDANELRTWGFFMLHAAIPAGVFWLMFEFRLRPRSGGIWKVLAWSEVYLVCALLTNRFWSDANFGFLARKPEQKTLLDLFPDTHWQYVLCINAVAVLFFLVLDLPWIIHRRLAGTRNA